MRNKKLQITKDILLTFLKIGGVLSIMVLAPNALQMLKILGFDKRYKKDNFSKSFYYLKNKKLIKLKPEGGGTKISLTERGRRRAFRYYLDDLKLKKPKKWDKKWRIVIFDIPEKRRLARDLLRAKLKELEFIKLQKSVFVAPYPCQKEIEFIIDFYKIKPYVIFIITKEIKYDKKLLKRFDKYIRS